MKLILIIIIFFLGNCTRFYYKNIKEEFPEKYPIEIKNNDGVHLIGFYPFKITEDKLGLFKRNLVVELDYSNSLKSNFIHSSNKEFKQNNTSKLDTEVVIRFIKGYLQFVGKSGMKEIESIIEIKDKTFFIKDKTKEIYILGIFGPDFKLRKKDDLKGSITNLFCFLSLGLIPSIQEFQVEGNFFIFNKELKLVSNSYYPITYKTITAIWMFPNEGFYTFFNSHEVIPRNAYLDIIERYNLDFNEAKNLKPIKSTPDSKNTKVK